MRSAALQLNLRLQLAAFITFLIACASSAAYGQTFNVLHNFTYGGDGAFPDSTLTLDQAGNLYGEAASGGVHGYGTAYRLFQKNGHWLFATLYSFQGGQDGTSPEVGLTFGPDGRLYGATVFGGGLGGMNCDQQGCGTIFALQPPPTIQFAVSEKWDEDVLYRFTGRDDGGEPEMKPAFDTSGNLYGTAFIGGGQCSGSGCGTVYQLTNRGGTWSFNLIHAFTGGNDGWGPIGGVTLDSIGNAFGVTYMGGDGASCQYGCGTVYEFSPSGSGWTENILYAFMNGSGIYPSGVLLDVSGNLYGSTGFTQNGGSSGGVVFELSPSGGSWIYAELLELASNAGAVNGLAVDNSGNLYGTTSGDDISNYGSVFKLTHTSRGWSYSLLHEFTGGTDGNNPIAPVVIDAEGNVYGVTSMGGTYGYGLVFEIMQ
jgi:uncharacterized repeat protein (TIGR03803 family)